MGFFFLNSITIEKNKTIIFHYCCTIMEFVNTLYCSRAFVTVVARSIGVLIQSDTYHDRPLFRLEFIFAFENLCLKYKPFFDNYIATSLVKEYLVQNYLFAKRERPV